MKIPYREEGEPVVTICIPSYNRADLIAETLDSVIAQSFTGWEAVVVDDGSTDASNSLIHEFCRRDYRIRFLSRDREPKGAGTCRNIAVQAARGRYVMFLDTDDVLAPFCLEQRVRIMEENTGLDFAAFPTMIFHRTVDDAVRHTGLDSAGDDLVRLLRMDPAFPGTGTLWRRQSFEAIGKWHEKLGVWQDIELHIRALTAGMRFLKRPDLPPDVYLRATDTSISRDAFNSRPKLESRALVARTAVSHLRSAGREDLKREVRFFCSSVILGGAASGNLDIALSLHRWARTENIFSTDENLRLMFAELARATRLDRLAVIRRLRDSLSRAFLLRPARQPA